MAKANSPIRLDASLMQEAKLAGSVNKRSQAEQIEYWASIGRSVDGLLDPGTLIQIQSGVASITLTETENVNIDADSLFEDLDEKRENGELADAISRDFSIYQASETNPGYLEQLLPDGSKTLGAFVDGEFIPQKSN